MLLSRHRALIAAICAVLCAPFVSGQKRIDCPNGEIHYEIDVAKLALTYQGQSFQTTLSGLGVLGAKVALQPTTLQAADAATQQWNQLLQGLAAGFNSCAVTQAQYNEGLQKIYPRLKDDAAELEKIRQTLASSRAVDRQRFQLVLNSYFANLRRFGQAGNNQIVEAIRAVVEQNTAHIDEHIDQSSSKILEKVDLLQKRLENLPRPREVKQQISALKQVLLAKADEAEREYNLGYDLMQKYRFKDAVPHLKNAVAAIPLPSFHVTLGSALLEVPDLTQAEQVLREGLGLAGLKPAEEASLDDELGQILGNKGDLPGAQRYIEHALAIDEKVYGPDHVNVADAASNLALFLLAKGDFPGAQRYAERALAITEKIYGPDHPTVAAAASNLGTILRDKGDLAGAQRYTERALQIDEKIYGPDHANVAIVANNLGMILKDKGDLPGAQRSTERALAITEKVYGPDHPMVAIYANNLGLILHDEGDLAGAQRYTERALAIDEKVYGPDHPNTAARANNLGLILKDKGDLAGAQRYVERALAINEKVYGPNHPTVAIDASNLGMILKDKGDLAGAQRYTERALAIDEKVYGPDHPTVARDANNLGTILKDEGDLPGAQRYAERALAIQEKVYGPDHPRVAFLAANLAVILRARGDLAGAKRYLQQAYSNAEKRSGAESPEAKGYAAALAKLKIK